MVFHYDGNISNHSNLCFNQNSERETLHVCLHSQTFGIIYYKFNQSVDKMPFILCITYYKKHVQFIVLYRQRMNPRHICSPYKGRWGLLTTDTFGASHFFGSSWLEVVEGTRSRECREHREPRGKRHALQLFCAVLWIQSSVASCHSHQAQHIATPFWEAIGTCGDA